MPKMPNLGRLPKLMKGMSERQARKEAAKQKEKTKIQDEKDMADVQGAKEGGRIGLKDGSDNPFFNLIEKISPLFVDEDGDYRSGLQKAKFALSDFIAGKGYDYITGAEWYNKLDDDTAPIYSTAEKVFTLGMDENFKPDEYAVLNNLSEEFIAWHKNYNRYDYQLYQEFSA